MVNFKNSMETGGLTLERRSDGQIWAARNGEEWAIRVHRCFPWSEPGRYLSLRDTDNEEVALIHSVQELEPASQRILQEAIEEVGFVLEVEEILEIDEEIEIRSWKVRTRQGLRSFQTKLDDWPLDVPGGGIIIRDVAGDLYHIAAPSTLDERSRKVLWAFID